MSSSPWKRDVNSPLAETNAPSEKQIMVEAFDVQTKMSEALEGRNALVGAKAIAFLIGHIACKTIGSEKDGITYADYIHEEAIDIVKTWFNRSGKKPDASQAK